MVFDKKEWILKNKDRLNEKRRIYMKEYRNKNKDRLNNRDRLYSKTPSGMKSMRTRQWKTRGVISDDWDMLHQHWELTSHCDKCHVYLEGNSKEKKCLDHCHTTGQFRNILCHNCNLAEPRSQETS